MADVFCMAQSSRAEYTHIKAEWPFIDFPKLLEDLVTDVVDRVLRSPLGHLVYELNHKFEPPNQSGENEKFQY